MRKIKFFAAAPVFYLVFLSWILSSCASQPTPYEQAKKSYHARNYSRAFQELVLSAKAGNPKAQYAMGYMYYYGLGTVKDQDVGRSLIRHAADQNYPPAIHALRLITKRKDNQYVPLEKYNANVTSNNEGIPVTTHAAYPSNER